MLPKIIPFIESKIIAYYDFYYASLRLTTQTASGPYFYLISGKVFKNAVEKFVLLIVIA